MAQAGKAIRTYRVAQIHDPEILDEAFPRPKNFDLATHWEKSARDYERGVYKGEAQVRLSPKGMGWLELLGPYVRDAARETAKPDRDGWVRCTLPIESVTHGVHELIRLREEVEVLGPRELRKAMVDTLASMTRHHSGK